MCANKTLAEQISDVEGSEAVVETELKTDQRVISRVTDGIYRQPGSALRELVSNAYDADAKKVVVSTDAPRFDRITIEDDGHGMTPASVAYLIQHIGGSAKRSSVGVDLGVTSSSDVNRSPGGRRLIGKIGIGLFSVSQLTRSFKIITKVKGDKFRTVASVALRQFSERQNISGDDEFESGLVTIWREPANDLNKHGSLIVLDGIRQQAKETLRSREIWEALEQASEDPDSLEAEATIERPKYHIGTVNPRSRFVSQEESSFFDHVPWGKEQSPKKAFKALVDAVWDEPSHGNPHPKISRLFDYYLQMIWNLSLSIPLPFVGKHPFDLIVDDPKFYYSLANDKAGHASELSQSIGKNYRSIAEPSEDGTQDDFEVVVDGLSLCRPIKVEGLEVTSHAITRPMFFFGRCQQEFAGQSEAVTGGPLRFSAYFMWNSKIVPYEHRGVLIRVHGSSGTLFDASFLNYQIAEITRLKQITCEIFVSEGLEAALNIDRESFNSSHPHVVFITRWLHSCLRQIATANKRVAAELRSERREQHDDDAVNSLRDIARASWESFGQDKFQALPEIEFSGFDDEEARRGPDSSSSVTADYVFSSETVFGERPPKQGVEVEKFRAIVQVLISSGALDQLSNARQELLLSKIYAILRS